MDPQAPERREAVADGQKEEELEKMGRKIRRGFSQIWWKVLSSKGTGKAKETAERKVEEEKEKKLDTTS